MENGALDKINAERIANLEKALNDRQDHYWQILNEVKSKSNGNGWKPAVTLISVVTGVAALFAGFIITGIDRRISELDDKLQIELGKADERSQARLHKLEEWQRWWYRRFNEQK